MAVRGQREEVMRLALEHRSSIWGFLMGLAKNPQQAEDLFQSTYLVICEKWTQFQPGTNFVAWARQIARYEFLASVDPQRRPFVTAEMDVLESALAASADRGSDREADRREALRECLRQMPARGQRALTLRYGKGLGGDGVAQRMNLSLNALYTLLSRVRRLLLDCMNRRLRAGACDGNGPSGWRDTAAKRE
jgi:RNA polymerase sigma-70 factor (ECF subfamily)